MIVADLVPTNTAMPGDKRKRYGFRVKMDESDPDNRVEYILDAVGMTPAHMNFGTGSGDDADGSFDYGSWKDVWFVRDNYPVMLKFDGTEDYRLKPDDYSKKANDTSESDVSKKEYQGNAMAAIPLCWVKRYQEDGYQYVIICEEQYDAGYKAYAHTRPDGTIAPVVYHAMFEGSFPNGSGEGEPKLRSIAGYDVYPENLKNATAEVTAAQLNNKEAGIWNVQTWALWSLLGDLLTLMSKSMNSQAKFGNGVTSGGNSNENGNHYGFVHCGSLNTKGQFYGKGNSDTTTAVKVFHIENLWGNRWNRIAGLLYINGIYRVKMTPEGKGYNLTGNGYVPAHEGIPTPASESGWQHETFESDFGRFPVSVNSSASETTFETDYFWWNNANIRVPLVGGSCCDGAKCGARCLACSNVASLSFWSVGATLSCTSPS